MRDITRVLVFALAACGPADRDPGSGGPDGGGNGDGNGNTENCSEEAKLVYTVDQNNTLSKFDPIGKTFMDIGTLSCPAMFLATPFSMGIDRNAGAWVLYSSGELFKVDTKTLDCVKTQWASSGGLVQFGMGFSTDTAGGTTDTLFIAGGSGPMQPTSELNRLDTMSVQAQRVGTVTGWPELTGTGNAELWGFFPTTPGGGGGVPRIEKIDKTTGGGLQTFMLSTLTGDPAAWAFAFFGGDFFVFLMRTSELATVVYQVDGSTGAIKGMTNTNTRTIVGAGVSTCAPVILL